MPRKVRRKVQNCGVYNTFTVSVFKKNKRYDYELSPCDNGKVWITNQDGEGFECDGTKFYEMLDKFWEDNY